MCASDEDAARRLALDESALDDLLEDARALRKSLSSHDRASLDDYLDAVRATEHQVQKAKRWVNVPLPKVADHDLQLEVGPEDSRNYLQAMFGLMFLALQTDSTRVVTYQIGRGNSVGISDYLWRVLRNRACLPRHQTSCRTLHVMQAPDASVPVHQACGTD